MKRVLVFGMTENPGGVESFLMSYYRNINRNELQFDFLCNSYDPIAYEQEILDMGGRTFHISRRSRNPIRYYKELNAFFNEHAKEYDTIWVNVCSLANIDYLKAAKKYGIRRRIIHCHGSQNMDSRLRGLLHQRNRRSIDRAATDFWSCSEDASGWFYPERLNHEIVIVRNAIDINKFTYNEESRNKLRKLYGMTDKTVIGHVGRLHFEKNQSFALDMFSEYLKIDQNGFLVLIGGGEDEAMLKEKAVKLGVSENVLFAGVQGNIPEWLSTMDMFLFPSLFEGMPIAPLEAQASGVSVLASSGVISDDAKINSNFAVFDLEKGAAEWAKKAYEMLNPPVREIPEKVIAGFTERGFNIRTEAEKLEAALR